MSEYSLNTEQREFLKQLQRLDASGSSYRSDYASNIRRIIQRGYYTDEQKKTISAHIIPSYKRYLKSIKT